MAAKIKGLQQWCRKMTEGYPHVDISNFTTAWRNGMAFCAIIHRFRPDLIDYDALSPDNVFENNKLAFEVGESELNIPAFLEADDMARLKVPDKLSVITYVSQYYNYLSNLPQLGGPGVKGAVKKGSVAGTKRPPDTSNISSEPSNKKTVSAKEDTKNLANSSTTSSPRKGTLGDKCGICNNKVYLLERHIDSGKLYHRSCYRHSDLSPTNKVLTKSPFMSPSLNNEKAMVVDNNKSYNKPSTNDSRVKHNNVNDSYTNRKGNEPPSVLSNLKSGLKRVEGGPTSAASAGSKHSIQSEKDKDDDAKKAKVQPRNLFGSGKENLNSASPDKTESVLPLSGKEAKKLEKRRQEILASENSTPTNKVATRGMPLVFQNKVKSDPPPSSISSLSSLSTNKFASGSDGTGDGMPNKVSSSKTPISVLDSKRKDSKISGEADKVNAVQNLQQKFSGQSQTPSNKTDTNMTSVGSNQPVARPRVAGSKIASSPFMDRENNKKGSDSDPVATRNKHSATPVAAPRKSMTGNTISDTKFSQFGAQSSSSEDNSTPRSSRSKSSTVSSSSAASTPPPALPLSPPPSLPQSKPPPLPTTPPPPTALSNSTKHRSTSPSSISSSSHLSHSSYAHDNQKDSHRLHPSSSSSSSPSSSTTTSSTAKISLKPTSPSPTNQPTAPSTLVTPNEKKGDGVLSGLLASLAGVRGRSASTPNTSLTIQQQQQPADTVTTTTTPKTPSKLTLNSTTTNTTTTTSLTVLSSNRKHSEPAIKIADLTVNVKIPAPSTPSDKQKTNQGLALKKVVPNSSAASTHNNGSNTEAANVLNSLKPVRKTPATTTSSVANSTKTDIGQTLDVTKSKNANNETKVGGLVKNYLSKSKEDLTSSDVSKTSDRSEVSKHISKDKQSVSSDNGFKKKGEADSQLGIKSNSSNTPVSNAYDVKLKKVGAPGDISKLDNVTSSKQITKQKMEDDKKKEEPLTPVVPQWKKDIEERKKKLKEDIKRSETPSKWTDKEKKEKVQPIKDTSSKQEVVRDTNVSTKPDKMPSSPHSAAEASSKDDHSKLNWQLEAERRMAAFALFDSEEESKSQDSEVEGKIAEMNQHRKRDSELKVNKSKDVNDEMAKYGKKIGLKTVDINIDGDGSSKDRKELSKPQSINNNNNVSVLNNTKKPSNETSIPRQKLEVKDKNVVNRLEDEKASPRKDRLESPKGSPTFKRKISVLDPKNTKNSNQKPSISPPTTPSVLPEKKKIAVIGHFDFDTSTPSDFESSLSRSAERISLEDEQTPHRPPRTKSQRNKAVNEGSPKQISAIELQQQLMEIDNRLTDLELRGRDLEDSIRNASFQEGSSEGASNNNIDDYDDEDEDRLMMEWFLLVSEKNDLVRQEADLVYLSREQDLEGEQEQIDHQLRYLLSKDDMIKSPQEKEEEAYLLQRKVDIVNQRSCIVDSMDEDRLRYEEEDRGIEFVLKSKGLWKDDGTFLAEQGRVVGNSTFFA